MSKRTSPEQNNNEASLEVTKRRKLVDRVEKAVEEELSKIKEDLIDDVLEKLDKKDKKEQDGLNWTMNKVKTIHFVGTWIPSDGNEESKPIHYVYWGWDEKRVKNILDVFNRIAGRSGTCMVRKPEMQSSSSEEDDDDDDDDDDDWRKNVVCLTMKGLWCLFLECMLDACNKDRKMNLSKEKMIMFKRLFEFDCREDLELKRIGELEDSRHHYSNPHTYREYPSYVVVLGSIDAKDPEYLSYNGSRLYSKSRDKEYKDYESSADEEDEMLNYGGEEKVYPNDPKDICPVCKVGCTEHPIRKCPKCRRIARCLSICHECTLEEEADHLAKEKSQKDDFASLLKICGDGGNDDKGEELQ